MLELVNIKKSFGERSILCGVNLKAARGQLSILEGENGTGKSTLFSILSGILLQDEGAILLDDQDLSVLPALERASLMAILKQDPKASSSPALSLMENCALAWLKNRRAGFKSSLSKDTKEKILNHLADLELNIEPGMLTRKMGELSGGQRQIYAFAMATINKPKLLLLDEPTAALDEKSSHLLMRLIRSLVKKWQIPAIMISHDHGLNQEYGDAIVILREGLIVDSKDKNP